MVTRKKIASALAERVQFASDRTCCICRVPGRRCQIAHIDNDSSNDAFDNLAFLCFDHHDEAHIEGGLARNLTPGIVRLYNESWREIVKGKLLPHSDVRIQREYQQEVMLEISLTCQQWIDIYLLHVPQAFILILGNRENQWNILTKNCSHPYSEETWKEFLPMANQDAEVIAKRLENILLIHPEAIPTQIKILQLRVLRRLKDFPVRYMLLVAAVSLSENDQTHRINFCSVFEALGLLDKEACKVKEALAIPD